MNSRERILQSLQQHQPKSVALPEEPFRHLVLQNAVEKFKTTLVSIGGAVEEIDNIISVKDYILNTFPLAKQIASGVEELTGMTGIFSIGKDPHQLKDIDVAILKGEFGVAENGAVWITDANMPDRALPFICANLILIIDKNSIVPTLHEAYDRIGNSHYELGTFIAGPSKTADIEQSLVLGAHGAKSLCVFLVGEN